MSDEIQHLYGGEPELCQSANPFLFLVDHTTRYPPTNGLQNVGSAVGQHRHDVDGTSGSDGKCKEGHQVVVLHVSYWDKHIQTLCILKITQTHYTSLIV